MLRLILFMSIFVTVSWSYLINLSAPLRSSLFGNSSCRINKFECKNKVCISKTQYCNDVDDCGDNSDEKYCYYGSDCRNLGNYVDCLHLNYYSNHKCIPESWKCDGVQDCPRNDDEENCEFGSNIALSSSYILRAYIKAWNWLLSNRDNRSDTLKWGSNVQRMAITLYLNDPDFMKKGNFTNEIKYELTISLLSRLALKKIEDIPTSELALFVNAFLLSCVNPRKFYVVNLVEELRKRVDSSNSTNTAALLALCNAQELITDADVLKLSTAFWEAGSEDRLDKQALIIMVLACAQKQNVIDQEDLSEMALELKKKQYRNGTVQNIKTTALVMHALFASEVKADEDNFDERKALEQIIRSQEKDGSFGNFMNTYYVLPVFNHLSFVNISSDHCSFATKDENDGLQYLRNQVGEKWNVKFSLWIGDDKVLRRSMTLSVPANTSFYGIMEYASDLDEKYKFQYNVRNRKPYIFALSGIMDDVEMDSYWLPYLLTNEATGDLKAIKTSVADYYPKNNEHLVFWYKNET